MSPADRRHVDVVGALGLAVDDVGDLGVAEPPEAEPEVERRAEHDDEVGALLQHAAGAQERQLVVGGERAATEAVEEARHAQLLDRGAQRLPRAVPVDVAADDERRPLGARRSTSTSAATASGSGAAPRRADGSTAGIDPADGAKNTSSGKSRNVGPRCGVSASRRRGVHRRCRLRRVLDRAGALGDRRDDGHVVHLLQRAGAPSALGRPAAEHDERRAVEPRAW